VTGLRCRGQIDLSVEWDRPAGTLRADLQSAVPQTITLRVPDWVGEPKLAGCGAAIAPSPRGRGYFELTLAAARNTLLEFCNRR
jgi:DUF1680 family protein